MAFRVTEKVTADKLQAGDHVMVAGAVFELTHCDQWVTPHENKLPSYSWGTRVVDASDTDMPAHWVARWRVQGNKLATFARVLYIRRF